MNKNLRESKATYHIFFFPWHSAMLVISWLVYVVTKCCNDPAQLSRAVLYRVARPFPVCCGGSSSPTGAWPREPVCLAPTATSCSRLQSALSIRAQHGSDALRQTLLVSFDICLRQACMCFWSRKSQLWLQSNCHKLKTGRGWKKRQKN